MNTFGKVTHHLDARERYLLNFTASNCKTGDAIWKPVGGNLCLSLVCPAPLGPRPIVINSAHATCLLRCRLSTECTELYPPVFSINI